MAGMGNQDQVSAELTVRTDGQEFTVRVAYQNVYGSEADEVRVVAARRAMNGFLAAAGLEDV